jgi:drug/metabolite transporter (DMT)-like permease
MRTRSSADAALLVVAFIWGATFVMVKDAVAATEPMTFLAVRFALAAAAMVAFAPRALARADRSTWKAGALAGTLLFMGYALQTYGLRYTSATKAGFLTGLTSVIVPLGAWLWLSRRPSRRQLVGVGLATVGLAALSVAPGERLVLEPGDALVALCAVAFAGQILVLDRYAPRLDPMSLASVELVTTAGLSAALAPLFGWSGGVPADITVWAAAAFTGVFATALAFAVQTKAQALTDATHTALLFATEPVWAAAVGAVAGERLTPAVWLGCGVILAGMLVVEWPAVGAGDETREGRNPQAAPLD